MTLIVKDPAGVSMDASTGMLASQISGLYAGATIAAGDACYIKGADGKVYPSDGTAADEKAVFAGIAPRAATAGQPITLFSIGARFHYAASGVLTPGVRLFIGATPGRLDSAATTGDAVGKVQCIDDTDIRVIGV